MSFIYCHLNFHTNLLRPWPFPLISAPSELYAIIYQLEFTNIYIGPEQF